MVSKNVQNTRICIPICTQNHLKIASMPAGLTKIHMEDDCYMCTLRTKCLASTAFPRRAVCIISPLIRCKCRATHSQHAKVWHWVLLFYKSKTKGSCSNNSEYSSNLIWREEDFMRRRIKHWSSLPTATVETLSLEVFRTQPDEALSNLLPVQCWPHFAQETGLEMFWGLSSLNDSVLIPPSLHSQARPEMDGFSL